MAGDIVKATNPIIAKNVQRALDLVWQIVDRGEPIADVIAWVAKKNHKSLSDWMCDEILPYLRRGERKVIT
jgi:hypothetical protein